MGAVGRVVCRLRTASGRLLTGDCLLPTADRLLTTAYRPFTTPFKLKSRSWISTALTPVTSQPMLVLLIR